jgi:hypothetical protein
MNEWLLEQETKLCKKYKVKSIDEVLEKQKQPLAMKRFEEFKRTKEGEIR